MRWNMFWVSKRQISMKNGKKSHLHMVRAKGGNPSPPLTVSLTVKRPFFYDSPYVQSNFCWSKQWSELTFPFLCQHLYNCYNCVWFQFILQTLPFPSQCRSHCRSPWSSVSHPCQSQGSQTKPFQHKCSNNQTIITRYVPIFQQDVKKLLSPIIRDVQQSSPPLWALRFLPALLFSWWSSSLIWLMI